MLRIKQYWDWRLFRYWRLAFGGRHSTASVPATAPTTLLIGFGTALDPDVQSKESAEFAKKIADPRIGAVAGKGGLEEVVQISGDKRGDSVPGLCADDVGREGEVAAGDDVARGGSNESVYLDQNNKQLLKLAEEHGYLLVSPLGYSNTGAYGTWLRLPAVFGQSDAVAQQRRPSTPTR